MALKFRLLKEELADVNGQRERYFIRGCMRVKIFEVGGINLACREIKKM